jgi:hypothetical protein
MVRQFRGMAEGGDKPGDGWGSREGQGGKAVAGAPPSAGRGSKRFGRRPWAV